MRNIEGRLALKKIQAFGSSLPRILGRCLFPLAVGGLVLISVFQSVAEDSSPQEKTSQSAKEQHKRRKRAADPIPSGDFRGQVDLTVCSQNLKLFGTFPVLKKRQLSYSKVMHEAKINDLTERFVTAQCDVIAVQEVIGKTDQETEAALNELSMALRKRTNRFFEVRVAPPADGHMTLGFLVALDRANILHTLSYSRVELPRINKKQKPRLFTRTPLEIQLAVQSRDSELVKTVSVINFHFKSKRGGEGDPTGLEWETYRMEMAEALRKIIEIRHKSSLAASESILLVVGDRNSNFDVATARILEGSLGLASFASEGPCRLSKRGVPLCRAESGLPRKLFSVLTSNEGVHTLPGTFSYKGEYSWLDELLMPAESLRYAWRTSTSEGQYNSGVVYSPKEASDHALVYVKLNW